MIRNRKIFYASLAVAALAALRRHATTIEDALGAPGAIEAALPSAAFWIAAAGALLALSLVPLRLGPGRGARLQRFRFEKEDLEKVRARVAGFVEVSDPDVPLLIDYVIFQAIAAGASDIHFDPRREGAAILYRIDGMMNDVSALPARLVGLVTNRLKVLSNLVVYHNVRPQDGRLAQESDRERLQALERSGLAEADFRIAFMPTLHGERIVIRILGKGEALLDFAELGMRDMDQRAMRRLVSQPQGMIILTGPTGSGKSTTIYAALRTIQSESQSVRSIATLEDPIELDLDGVNQSQVAEERGFTFDKGLRAVLRQDPDVIMVGEIRDPETARIALQAGMTGHLIITTVHANSSASAFPRLLELGVAAHSLNAAVSAVVSQRLVRMICPHCRRERGLTEHDYEDLGFVAPPEGFKVFYGTGCEACSGSGYLGRTAIFEILEVSEPIRRLVSEGAPSEAIHAAAKEAGMVSVHSAGIDAVAQGITSPEEIARVVSKEER